jgi:hypothetical protein
MLKRMGMSAVLLSACVLGSAAHAAEFEVGRATVAFSTEDWRETVLPEKGLGYAGDKTGAIASEVKMYIKESPQGRIEAVVLLQGTKGGLPGALMTYSRSCEGNKQFFAEGTTGDSLRFAHCLRVFPLYTASSLLAEMGADVQLALKDEQSKLPEGMYAITSEYSNSNGTSLRAFAMLAAGFEGIPGQLDVDLPSGIEAGHVVWGRQLNSAVRGSVTSIFGKMDFPDVSFAAPPDADNTGLPSGQPK